MILLTLDETSRNPHYQQILEQIREKIETRVLRPGEKLPSTRRLADSLGVHRSTVANAYQELWALGFVDLSPGSRPRVRERAQIATSANRTEKGLINWHAATSTASNTLWQTYCQFHSDTSREGDSACINFSSLELDQRLFPLENFRSCLNQAIRTQGSTLLGYGDSAGYLPLREYITRHLQSHGISVTSDEILITNGLQQGIDLVFRMMAAPGRSVAIESPTYKEVIPLLRFCGLKPLEIPMRHDGMDLSVLAQTIEKQQPALLYTMPNFQNPTGISTNQTHREQLLSLCEKHRIPILEDGFEEEMKYFGKAVLPIKSMDKHHLVIYCGTFSKILFSGVRIGWIAADRECIKRLMAIRSFSDLSSSMILQSAIYEFCQNGHYGRHISKMHRTFRKRMQTAIRSLAQYISPDWAEWNEPSGGYLIWLKLKPVANPSLDWRKLFASYGVQVAFGGYFFCSETSDIYLRLSISKLNEAEIEAGIKRLANALQHVYA